MEIGKPLRKYVVEPLEDPVPRKEPAEAPAEEPMRVAEPEPATAE